MSALCPNDYERRLRQAQKSYTLNELQPGTSYEIRIRAHNNAGSSVAEYKITTLQPPSSSTVPALDVDRFVPHHTSVYADPKLIVPLVLSSCAVFLAAGAVFYCFRKSKLVRKLKNHMYIYQCMYLPTSRFFGLYIRSLA